MDTSSPIGALNPIRENTFLPRYLFMVHITVHLFYNMHDIFFSTVNYFQPPSQITHQNILLKYYAKH